MPIVTSDSTAIGTTRLLEAIRKIQIIQKFYQASSSEMFGKVLRNPQTENSILSKKSLCGIKSIFSHDDSKLQGVYITYIAVMEYYLIMSLPLRGENFVTRKITLAFSRIFYGKQKYLEIGNLDAKRDWGYAGDYVEAMHLMLKQKNQVIM